MPANTNAPSEEMQTIIDKTAEFVARLGADFEKRITDNEKNNPKFSFLKKNDQLFGYYQNKVKAFRDALGSSVTTPLPQVLQSLQSSTENGPSVSPMDFTPTAAPAPSAAMLQDETVAEAPRHGSLLAKRILSISRKTKNGPLEGPLSEQFILDYPDNIVPIELEVIKLTAQFVAKNGHQFQIGLMNREHKNPQFDFLKQGHEYHSFFLSLVEAYTKIILPPKNLIEKLKNDYSDKEALLDRIIGRHVYETEQERLRKQAEDEQEKERQLNAMIDWHDFIIVETIDFNDDDVLPPPPKDEATGGDVEMDTDDMDMEDEPKRPAATEIRIKRDYAKPSQLTTPQLKYQICPKCGQEIPVDEMENHMKIELLDPQARQQRIQINDRVKAATVASDDEISRNLQLFATKRPDIFGGVEVEMSKAKDKPAPPKDDKMYDGRVPNMNMPTSQLVGKSLDDQIAAIHAAKGSSADSTSTPSPAYGMYAPPTTSSLLPVPPPPGINPQSKSSLLPTPPPPPPSAASGLLSTPPPPPPTSLLKTPPPPPLHAPPMPAPAFTPMPPPIPQFTPRPPEDEPSAKRQKVEETQLIPEAEFLQQHSGPITLKVVVPHEEDKAEFNLKGQTLSITADLKDTIATIKEKIQEQTKLPPNKQTLKSTGPILKDQMSLAYYNFLNDTELTLAIKARGGRKKK